ncbi:NH(3)-dependent NAD(+) synthetase [Alteribacillus persepolensis]|uniref:NH(3)-dependent NAD(+) synthetase n=1 Tax=Alteribacillus persepolensis TaxID=568899 RepID=A0A1G7YZ43_9BACI|nr:ammonia-dependent NAD(+) synthetase [Alteribacillus persepolensis]SDH01723.1 NH(3)-dependent NAD(+) synthetase [Alteribacillus persepolensis]
MRTTQNDIINDLQVRSTIDSNEEITKRVRFLKEYAKQTGSSGFVLGVSGGQDSSLAGKLAQLAVNELNKEETKTYTFIAVRLPYGKQFDEDDAAAAMAFISPDKDITVNIQPAVDASERAFEEGVGQKMSDFNKGNTKARERMKVQYDIAAEYGCLVIGTDHAAEAVTGFFTKHGDGACDIAPLAGLNKRQGKQLLKELNAPASLYEKVPTADLESDKPGLPDEEALGMTYEQIDDFLEGKTIDTNTAEKLIKKYNQTEHKRQLPVTIHDSWWKS